MTRTEAIRQLTAPGEPYEIVPVTAIGREVRTFKGAPNSLRDVYANTVSDLTFLVYEDERLTFREAWERSCTLAHALVAQYGVKKGDRVALSMRNYPEWMIGFAAVTSIGAIAVALNALWQPSELEFGLGDCDAKVLICDQERLDRLAQITAPANLQIIAVRTTKPLPANARPWEDMVKAPFVDAMPEVDIDPDDDAIMLYTSGSTGNPKGAVSTHRMVVAALCSWELDAQIGILRGVIPAPADDAPQSVILLGIPLFHVTGLHYVFLMCYRLQRRLVSMYKWDAERAAELIERERVTAFAGPAAVTGDLVELARHTTRDLSSLANIGGGGAHRAAEQVRAIDKVFQNAKPGTGWGMTETNAIGTGITSQDYLDHPESSGQVSAVLDIRIADEEGNALPTGERGELQIKGVSIMRGYWNRPDANAQTFDGGWMRTGDVAYVDPDGFVYIVDRLKELVIRGGENIGCGQVEAAFLEHPDVLEVSVYGVPDQRLGEEVAATVYTDAPVSEADLKAFLAPKLAKFQIPRYLYIVHEPLPRIASGKIFKRQLRAEAIDRLKEPVA